MKRAELSWIDDFFAGAKKHFFVREDDSVLILPPNRVFKLNETGLGLFQYLFSGRKLADLDIITDGERADEVHYFFSDIKAFFSGCTAFSDTRRGMERIPYGFDYTTLPILGEIAVTYRCNNQCKFCYAGCGGKLELGAGGNIESVAGGNIEFGAGGEMESVAGKNVNNKASEMTLEEIKKVIRIFRSQAKIPFFSFTGGEPLVRHDLEKMIVFAGKQGLRVNLITNGTLATEKRVSSLYKSGLRTAQVSLESADRETHDLLTGIPGSFEKTLAGIKNLAAGGIRVQTNTTLTAVNINGIEDYPQFIKELGITHFSMNLFIPSGRGLFHDELFYPYSKIAPVIEKIRKAALASELTFYWYSPVPYCYYNPVARGLGNKSCAAMDGLVSVSPTGDVLPCSSYPESMGNLLDSDFNTIWFSERARFFKEKHFKLAECGDCSQFTACQSACPLYFQYAGAGEIKNRKKRRESCSMAGVVSV